MFVTECRSFPARRYRVDLNERVCSCAYLFQMGLPCRHVLAGLIYSKRLKEEATFVDACFSIKTFAEQYDWQDLNKMELLLNSDLNENEAIRAPVVVRKRGRPKSNEANSIFAKDATSLLNSASLCLKRRFVTCDQTEICKTGSCNQTGSYGSVPLANEDHRYGHLNINC
ncbi:hypothetical protein CCR75_004028 [Bremia lactucae]|uniref:SWIM-type domain-containing protein n=1 Tax=Bremia lactucae TaxID=4779 RepID=A0A976FNX5_BRELC|nr:hypothetical protein CCR75_004028 [Bremia lactucae]